ncbi:Glyoxalase/Bleomycin resistance protein/Dioxygenase superfamily protein [compost metagenome]
MLNPEIAQIGKIDHLGIAVRSIEAAMPLYTGMLGLELHEIEEVADQKVRTAVFPVGESRIELLEPTSPDSPVAKFLEKRGEGIHHVALGVQDVAAALAKLKAEGAQLIDEAPRKGAGGALIAFVHPKSTGGVLLELCQR